MIRLASAKVLLGVVAGLLGAGGVAAAVTAETPPESQSWSPNSALYGVSAPSDPDGTLIAADDDDEEGVGEGQSELEALSEDFVVDPSDGLSDEELEVLCAEADSHGEYVSQVARDRVTETDGNHGERVREAAHSDCGKADGDEEPPSVEAIEAEVDPSDGLSDEELEVLCAEADSHGEYVSQVARDRVTETDGNHGERVREAAQSDCGKSGVTGGDETSSIEAAESDIDHPGGNNGNGNGGNNGNGNGNGHGRGQAK